MKHVPARLRHCLLLGCLVLIGLIFFRPRVAAVPITSCSASVSLSSVVPGSTSSFTITLNNTDEENIQFIRIVQPNEYFTFTGHTISGWNVNFGETDMTINNNNVTPGETFPITFTARADGSEHAASSWTVEVSDEPGGSEAINCTGSLSTAIANPPPSNAPTISSIQVSDISGSGAKITWSTNEDATSVVEYGESSALGKNSVNSSYGRSHEISLGSLTSNKLHYYKVKSTDRDGNTGESAVQTFTTAATGSAPSTPTATPTPTPVPDTTGPILSVTFPAQQLYKDPPEITGSASDAGNVTTVQYTLDGGKTWKAATQTNGLNSPVATFVIRPEIRGSGVHRLSIRALDTVKNTTRSKEFQFLTDQTPPAVTMTTDLSAPFAKAPQLNGTVTDQNGIAFIEYSLDGGTNWKPVDTQLTPGVTVARFGVTPLISDDGTYTIQFRAGDALGNAEVSESYSFILDRLPPQVGGTVVRVGSYVILPAADGRIHTVRNVPHTLVVSSIGGTTEIALAVTDRSTPAVSQTVSLQSFGTEGLWAGTVSFADPGTYTVRSRAVDAVGNETEQELLQLTVTGSGTVRAGETPLPEGQVTVMWKRPDDTGFEPWQGDSYGQPNPVRLDGSGQYAVLVPPGTYYLRAEAPGYRPTVSSIVTVHVPTPLTADLHMVPKRTIRIGPLVLPWFDFGQTTQDVQLAAVPRGGNTLSPDLPKFRLQQGDMEVTDLSLRGKTFILTFLNSWLPQSADQMTLFEQTTLPPNVEHWIIVPQETQSRVAVFRSRGNYARPLLADPDGTMVVPFQYGVFPMHVVVSSTGSVVRRQYGVTTVEQLLAEQ